MGSTPRKHTQEYKDEAVQLMFESDRPLAGVASRDPGTPSPTVTSLECAYRQPATSRRKSASAFVPARLKSM